MSFNLVRGQQIPVYDAMNNTGNLLISFGWNEAPKKTTLLSRIKKTPSFSLECDISAALLYDNNTIQDIGDLIYHNNKVHKSTNAISLLGPSEYTLACEQININLDYIPEQYDKIVFIGTIYDADKRKQNFSMLQNMYISIYNLVTNYEICRFDLVQDYSELTTMFFGKLLRSENGWEFNAQGDGSHDVGAMQAIRRYKP